MIILDKNEKIEVIEFENKFYTCVFNSEGLQSFFDMPYLKIVDKFIKIDIALFNKDITSVGEYDINNNLQNVKNPYDYLQFVTELYDFQFISFQVNALNDYLVKNKIFDESLTKQVATFSDIIEKIVKYNEKALEEISKQIPANWPHAMFDGNSWTNNDYFVNLFNYASGNTSYPAKELGTTKNKIKNYLNETREKHMKIFDALNNKVCDLLSKENTKEDKLEM